MDQTEPKVKETFPFPKDEIENDILYEGERGWYVDENRFYRLIPDSVSLPPYSLCDLGPYPNKYSAKQACWLTWIEKINQDKLSLSYSFCTTFNHCRMNWYWQYIEDLTPAQRSFALQTGDITHKLLDLHHRKELTTEILKDLPQIVQKINPNNSEDLTSEVVAESAGLVLGYLRHYANDILNITSPEVHMELDVGPYRIYTRLDGMGPYRYLNRIFPVRLELKTAGKKDSGYLTGYQRSLQTGIAHWILSEVFPEVEGSLHRMLVKTKVPQYLESYQTSKLWQIRRAKATVAGIYRSLKNANIYPSMECMRFNRYICDFDTICRSDTTQNRNDFYQSRKEVKKLSFKDPKQFLAKTGCNPNHDLPLTD